MVARITTPASLNETLNYNEHKVRKGVGVCIAENNFLLPLNAMNFYHKLEWFESRNDLNTRATTKTLHVSLNFAVAENFSPEKLTAISRDYMERLGFAEQPYLVYQHKDAGHPHVHIVATTIREDGSRINTHNIGKNQSEVARKLVEEKYGLVKAGKMKTESEIPVISSIEKLEYGKAELKRSIANVLKQTINLYNYNSLTQFNAVLRQYNVMADRGKEGSFTQRKNGLLYRMLDKDGVAIGVPIKASTIAGKPTLAYLEERFLANEKNRPQLKLSMKATLDETLSGKPATLQKLIEDLQTKSIQTVLRQNAEGRIYGITFIDHKNRSVFNGSEIGKEYSIAGLTKFLKENSAQVLGHEQLHHDHKQSQGNSILGEAIDDLFHAERSSSFLPHQLKKKRKKKRGI
ncbi:MAG: relaxase/mobilization nuclease domain-containing protein [Bacteroidota bacterium]